jgi:hypothetical protein
MRKMPGIRGEDDEQPARSSAIGIVSAAIFKVLAVDVERTE